jgi:predicted aldo/keto reductase-like oxidoreductase
MSDRDSFLPRRAFLQNSGLAAGGLLAASALAGEKPAAALPQRTLGKTGVRLTTMTLGTAPCGNVKDLQVIGDCLNAAIDLGINSIDTAPAYIAAEEGIGRALGRRRKEVFLATKVMADTIEDAEKSFSKSLKLLKTDSVDLVYFHHLGDRKMDVATNPDGVFTWLVKQKKAGKARFLGISGHNRPGRFARFLKTGEVDVLLAAVNFVDRHTYNFEEEVLPVAREQNVGIFAMKVFGGAGGNYSDPKCGPKVDPSQLSLAIRYALDLPGVTSVNLGVHTVEQVRKNVEMVRAYQPLTADEQAKLAALGKELAPKWGTHFGEVTG